VVMIGKEGRNIPRERAFDHVAGYGVGLDMTLRDVQAEAKKRDSRGRLQRGSILPRRYRISLRERR